MDKYKPGDILYQTRKDISDDVGTLYKVVSKESSDEKYWIIYLSGSRRSQMYYWEAKEAEKITVSITSKLAKLFYE